MASPKVLAALSLVVEELSPLGPIPEDPRISPILLELDRLLPIRRWKFSSSAPAKLARCLFIGLPTNESPAALSTLGFKMGCAADPDSRGGVVDKSSSSFGVDEADGVADLEALAPAFLLSGSAEC